MLRSGGNRARAAPRSPADLGSRSAPTPVQHLVAEYEADVTTVSEGHIEDFLRGVGEWHDDWSADARAQVIERQRQRSIHVHCWSQDEFSETLLHVLETGRQPWDLLDAVFVEDVVDSIEFGYVLRKLPADREAKVVSARFARCSSASVRGHRPNRECRKALDRLGRRRPRLLRSFSEAVPSDHRSDSLRRRGRAMVARLR